MKIVILEDEHIIAEKLCLTIEGLGHEVIARFDNAEELLNYQGEFELALLDINLNGKLDGIDFVNRYNKREEIAYIFISDIDDDQKIDRASSTSPVTFLSKPYKKKDLSIALKLAEQRVAEFSIQKETTENELTFVKDGDRLVSIDLRELLYIEGQGSYSHIVTSSLKQTVSQNIGALEKKITTASIIRVHRSYIVNVTKLDEIKNRNSIIIASKEIPIGETYKEKLFEMMNIL